MFSLPTFSTSLAPLPPTPMPAMFSRLFAPSTLRRATKGMASAAVVMTVRLTNCRRVNERTFIIGNRIGCLHLLRKHQPGQGQDLQRQHRDAWWDLPYPTIAGFSR